MTLLNATRPIILAKLEEATARNYPPGVLGVHADDQVRGRRRL